MIQILISLLLLTCMTLAKETLTLSLSKSKVYLGEAVPVTLKLTYDPKHPPRKIEFQGLKLAQVELQALPIQKDSQKGTIYYPYLLTALVTGQLTLSSQQIALSHKDTRTYRNIWTTLQSQSRTLEVLPLPQGIEIVGNYTLKSHIDTQTIQADKPINLTITMEGNGNLSNMKALSLLKSDTLIFTSAPIIEVNQTSTGYQSRWQQSFAILAQEDYTVSPLQITYLNSDTQLLETLITPSYLITVDNPKKQKNMLYGIALLILGILMGILLSKRISLFRKRKKRDSKPLAVQIKKAGSDQALYRVLLPHADNPQIAPYLQKLEENLYHDAKHTIDIKSLLSAL